MRYAFHWGVSLKCVCYETENCHAGLVTMNSSLWKCLFCLPNAIFHRDKYNAFCSCYSRSTSLALWGSAHQPPHWPKLKTRKIAWSIHWLLFPSFKTQITITWLIKCQTFFTALQIQPTPLRGNLVRSI